jgi:hypothetical protein
MKTIRSILIVILFFILSCDQYSTTPVSENNSSIPDGLMKITMDMTNAPSEVDHMEGKLYNDDGDEIYFDFEIDDNSATALVDDIPSGNWKLRVDAYDEDNNLIYTGITEITVYPGVVTPVSLHLNPATGSLEITVTWGTVPGLVAYYPFNGNANDESGNLNHGVVFGAARTTDRFGNPNSAYIFDGEDDYIISDITDWIAKEYSVSIWVKSFNIDQSWYTSMINNFNNPPWGWIPHDSFQFDFDNSNPKNYRLHFQDEEGNFVLFNQVTAEWKNLVAIYDGFEVKTFVNGEIQHSAVLPPDSAGTNFRDYVFGRNRVADNYFEGKIDDIRIYNRALSESEIQRLYHSDGSEIPTDDQFEDNDQQSDAVSLYEYTYYRNLYVSAQDDDWYSMTLSADSLSIACDFIHANGNINMDLVDNSGAVLASSQSLTDNERIHFIVNQLDTYYIHIYMSSGNSNTYTFWWDDIWQGQY